MAKELKYLRKFDPKRDATENWQEADKLNWGWFGYSPCELQERYRDSGRNLAASKSLQLDMQLEVRERIAAGEILAFGIQILPEPHTKAEQIPTILFQSDDVKIDWEGGKIRGFGRQFDDVRICLSENRRGGSDRPVIAAEPTKRGRKRYDSIFEEAFTQLELEHDNFEDWSLEKQVNEIQERAGALHPGRFKGSKPGRSTIYRFLHGRTAGPSVP